MTGQLLPQNGLKSEDHFSLVPDQGLHQHRDAFLLLSDLLEVIFCQHNTLFVKDVSIAEPFCDLGLAAVADTNGSETFVDELEIVQKVRITAVDFSHDCHRTLPLGVILVDKFDGLAGDEVCHGRCDVEHDTVWILNVVRVDVLDKWSKSLQVCESRQVNKSQVEEVTLVDPEVDRLFANLASHRGQIALLLVNHTSDVGKVNVFRIVLSLSSCPYLSTLFSICIPQLHHKRASCDHTLAFR